MLESMMAKVFCFSFCRVDLPGEQPKPEGVSLEMRSYLSAQLAAVYEDANLKTLYPWQVNDTPPPGL